jgi:hypothetical protein
MIPTAMTMPISSGQKNTAEKIELEMSPRTKSFFLAGC